MEIQLSKVSWGHGVQKASRGGGQQQAFPFLLLGQHFSAWELPAALVFMERLPGCTPGTVLDAGCGAERSRLKPCFPVPCLVVEGGKEDTYRVFNAINAPRN